MVILISVWKQVSVNFIFFLSGLQGIPRSVNEAAMKHSLLGMSFLERLSGYEVARETLTLRR